jgi:ABC-type molybdate transport system substrate-binding protein
LFEKETETTVRLDFASSGTLARQIENGAHLDIFISAAIKMFE